MFEKHWDVMGLKKSGVVANNLVIFGDYEEGDTLLIFNTCFFILWLVPQVV